MSWIIEAEFDSATHVEGVDIGYSSYEDRVYFVMIFTTHIAHLCPSPEWAKCTIFTISHTLSTLQPISDHIVAAANIIVTS